MHSKRTLVVVACGKSKIWDKEPEIGPAEARCVYQGTPFKVNREYAEKYAKNWVILSAKYGFINPNFLIDENYNVTFNDPNTGPITVDELGDQVDEKYTKYEYIISLGSTRYSEIVRKAFKDQSVTVISPVAGLPIGKAVGKVKKAIRENQHFPMHE